MEPIKSFREVCLNYGLDWAATTSLQSLVLRRKGALHPYWIQLTLYVQYEFAKRLYDELIANEWAVPDNVDIDGHNYESELTGEEIEAIALIELSISNHFA